ncbi:WW domain-containing protein [Aphelenchoides avenae]|nr:WW domain-containing protein [Aphelenchus avenae]
MERHSIPRLKSCGPWSEQTSSSGKRYYYNKETEVSQWEKPQEWREAERKLERSHHKRSNNSASTNAKVSATSTKTASATTGTTTLVVNNSATQRHNSSTAGSGHNTPSQAQNNANASRVISAVGAQVSSNHTSTTQRSKIESSSKLHSNSHSHSQTKNGESSRGASNSPLLIASVPTASPSSTKPQLPVKVEAAAKAVSSSPSARSSPRENTRSPATYPTAIKSDWSAVKASPKSSPSGGGERKQSAVSNGTMRCPPPPVVVTRTGFAATSHQAATCSSTTTTSARISPPVNPIQSIPSTSATVPVVTVAASSTAVRVNGQNGQGPGQGDAKPEVKPQPIAAKETPPVKSVKRPFEHLEVANASQPSTSQISTMEARYAKFYRPELSAHRRNWNGDYFMEQSRKAGERVLRQKLLVATLDNDLTSVRSLMRTAEVRTELITQKGDFLREQLETIEAKPTMPALVASQPIAATTTEAPVAQSATTVT